MGDGSGRLGMFFVFVLGWVGLVRFGLVWYVFLLLLDGDDFGGE